MSRVLIGLSGYAGSGKSTAAAYLCEHYGFREASFAEPLKRMAQIAFGFSDEQLYGRSSARNAPDKRYPFSGVCPSCGVQCERGVNVHWFCERCDARYDEYVSARLALQTLGMEWGRRLYPNVWVDAAMRMIEASDAERIVVSDMRFPNELDAIKQAGGLVVRLTRGAPLSLHESETALEGYTFDARIHGSPDVRGLYRQIDSLVLPLIGGRV